MDTTLGVIGLGRWGLNYLRTFNELKANVKWLCASTQNTIDNALSAVPIVNISNIKDVKTTLDYRDIINDKDVDAVAVVTPGSKHYSMTKEALENNKHVLVEKPLAFSYSDAAELTNLADSRNRLLMVSNIHHFNPGIAKIKNDIEKGLFGRVYSIQINHFGNAPVRTDMSALWDFGPHAASILLDFFGRMPLMVNAYGRSFLKEGIEDFVSINMEFMNAIATASMGWLYPKKKMEISVIGEKMAAIFNDYAENKLKYYVRAGKTGKNPVFGDAYIPKIGDEKPLTGQLRHFLERLNSKNFSNDKFVCEVTKVLEAAQESITENKAIKIGY